MRIYLLANGPLAPPQNVLYFIKDGFYFFGVDIDSIFEIENFLEIAKSSRQIEDIHTNTRFLTELVADLEIKDYAIVGESKWGGRDFVIPVAKGKIVTLAIYDSEDEERTNSYQNAFKAARLKLPWAWPPS